MKRSTVLITGASQGLGYATAHFFAKKGWNVAATMRNPEKTAIKTTDNLKYFRLDVTDNNSIHTAINNTITAFGNIDVLINNAGFAVFGPFEEATHKQILSQYNTNVFGCMNVIRSALPHFRKKRNGVIINVSTLGGRIATPLYSIYQSSKFALEGFTESLHFELKPFNVKVKLIEPGGIKTKFMKNHNIVHTNSHSDYYAYTNKVHNNILAFSQKYGIYPKQAAKGIYKAALDKSNKLRYSVGQDSKMLCNPLV